MSGKTSTYFVSDFHLGTDGGMTSKEREKKILRFFDVIKKDAKSIYLLGDVFDYWFEYKRVVPKGFTRLMGKLAELTDQGIHIEFFTGNHDMWVHDYFEQEFGIKTHKEPRMIDLDGKKLFIGHGDGLGPGDRRYKFLKKFLSNYWLQKAYSIIHPNLGLKWMKAFSRKSRASTHEPEGFLGSHKEWLVQFAESVLEKQDVDYFVFGHRHLPIYYPLSNKSSIYVNLGDWLNHYSYAKYAEGQLQIYFFENPEGKIYP